jgi:enamine deaminase RidA (YjgF/YER057c/UK114 family)
MEKSMENIKRSDINEQWAHSGIVEAGDFAFISYCVGNIGQPIENQINNPALKGRGMLFS